MKLTYNLSVDDFIEFNWYIHWARPERGTFRLMFRILPFVVVLAIIVFTQLSDPRIGPREVLLLIPAVAFSWFGSKYIKWRLAKSIRKKADAGGYDSQISERSLEVDEKGVRLITENSDDSVVWGDFDHWHETANYVFIFLAKNQALLVPKRVMKGPELEDLKARLTKNMGAGL